MPHLEHFASAEVKEFHASLASFILGEVLPSHLLPQLLGLEEELSALLLQLPLLLPLLGVRFFLLDSLLLMASLDFPWSLLTGQLGRHDDDEERSPAMKMTNGEESGINLYIFVTCFVRKHLEPQISAYAIYLVRISVWARKSNFCLHSYDSPVISRFSTKRH